MFPKELQQQVISGPDYPVVQTKYGKLRGIETDGVFIFRGVHYAKAKRFMMPEEPDSWEGIKNARSFGCNCIEVSTLIPADGYTVPHYVYPQSEDCQVLNIWTKSIDPSAKKPVMLWIHGGGYQHGSSIEIFSYDGENLAKKEDVVVVSLNHRLHALGYMDLSGYDYDRYRYTGNLGTADIIAALKWIKANISAFGGDPDNVMLFGQSGGAGKIQALLQTPAADGLYHKVSLQSGVSGSNKPDVTQEKARIIADYVVRNLGLTKESIRSIETLPFHELAWAITQAREQYLKDFHVKRMEWAPVCDKDYYLGNGFFIGFRDEVGKIPALVGNVLGEFKNNSIDPLKAEYGPKCDWDEEKIEKRLNYEFGDKKEEIVAAYKKAFPDIPAVNTVFTGTVWRENHVAVAKALKKTGADVWNWYLTLELPADGGSTPWHNAEEPFVFHNTAYIESTYIPGVTDRLDELMGHAWAVFAATGNPNNESLPYWEQISEEETKTMRFDRECGMMKETDDEFVYLVNHTVKDPNAGDNGPKLEYGGGPRNNDGGK